MLAFLYRHEPSAVSIEIVHRATVLLQWWLSARHTCAKFIIYVILQEFSVIWQLGTTKAKCVSWPFQFTTLGFLAWDEPLPQLWHKTVWWGMESCIHLFFCIFSVYSLYCEAFFHQYYCHNIKINGTGSYIVKWDKYFSQLQSMMGQECFFNGPYQEKVNTQRIASDTAQATVEKGTLCSLSGQPG